MNLLYLRSSLLYLRHKAQAEESHVISVTEFPTYITAADSGKTYSLDSEIAVLVLPARSEVTTAYTITVQCTVINRQVMCANAEVGLGAFYFADEGYDGVSLDSLDAVVTITYDGTYWIATVASGEVYGYYD